MLALNLKTIIDFMLKTILLMKHCVACEKKWLYRKCEQVITRVLRNLHVITQTAFKPKQLHYVVPVLKFVYFLNFLLKIYSVARLNRRYIM